MSHPTLYKRTSTGAIQTWRMELSGERYRTTSGQDGGACVTTEWTVAQPKNVGRSNETSANEQAALEVAAKYEKKLKSGYFKNREDIDKQTFFKPMLAKSYDKYTVDPAQDRWYSQPKLDGIRCVARATGLWTRTGEPITTCPHVYNALAPVFDRDPEAVIDGEIYSDRLSDDFNRLVSLAKRKDPTPEQLAAAAMGLEYHVYDAYFPGDAEARFIDRFVALKQIIDSLVCPHPVRIVETTLVRGAGHMDELYAGYLTNGQEGQMLRSAEAVYQNTRTKDLLKRKEFMDAEYVIVSVHEGQGNRSGMAGYVILALDGDRTFRATPKGANADRIAMLQNAEALVGKLATVQHFAFTPDGVPRFPVLKTIHEQPRW